MCMCIAHFTHIFIIIWYIDDITSIYGFFRLTDQTKRPWVACEVESFGYVYTRI